MLRDPRNPEPNYMVHSSSTHEFHRNLRKTLVLLCIERGGDAPIYFVVEGLAHWPAENLQDENCYFYEEHSCPTNFISIPLIAVDGDTDPHGVFSFVDAVWMMDEYEAAVVEGAEESYICEVFSQLARKTAQ